MVQLSAENIGAAASLLGSGGTDKAADFASSAVSGAVSFIPGVGPLLSGFAGSAAGAITKFLGGSPRVPFGKAANDAAPHRMEGYLDMSGFAQDNGNEYARWAIENNCTVEDIEAANGLNRAASGHSWEQVTAWYRSHPEQLRSDLAAFFAANPRLKGAGPAAVTPASVLATPQYQPQPLPMPTSQAFSGGFNPSGLGFVGTAASPKFTYVDSMGAAGPAPAGQQLSASDLLKAALEGAKTAVTGKFLETPEGKKATDQGAVEFMKSRWYIPLGLVALIVGLAVAAFGRRR
jgi:hypothetical protein